MISVNNGYVTWKYWLRHVQHVDLPPKGPTWEPDSVEDTSSTHDNAEVGSDIRLQRNHSTRGVNAPSRITVNLRGLEWFVYNRSPAYDSILASMLRYGENEEPRRSDNGSQQNRDVSPLKNDGDPDVQSEKQRNSHAASRSRSSDISSHASEGFAQVSGAQPSSTSLPSWIKLLPIEVRCRQGAMVMGNAFTKSILVAKFDRASGSVDAASASGPFDLFKQRFDFELESFNASFKPNRDHQESLLVRGSRSQSKLSVNQNHVDQPKAATLTSLPISFFRRLSAISMFRKRSIESLVHEKPQDPKFVEATHSNPQDQWLGLSRYLDQDDDDLVEHERWRHIDYAQSNTIVNCPSLALSFFYDAPGKVQKYEREGPATGPASPAQNINGSSPPDWALDIIVGGGLINYGPWADRQRVELQSFFFPPAFSDALIAAPLKLGEPRQSTQFKITVTLDKSVVLRLHTKEESKDWKWKGTLPRATSSREADLKRPHRFKKNARDASNNELRPAGWVDITIAADACFTYDMDLLAKKTGYQNNLRLDTPSLSMSTSVNHDSFLRSKKLTMSADLANPVQWNALRNWTFDLDWDALELFLLRDHLFLFTDLITDWTSGSPSEYLNFVPFTYNLNLMLRSFKLYLNVNDANIIDSPVSLDSNAFLVFCAASLNSKVSIPLHDFRPLHNEITFDATATSVYLELVTPAWNTLSTFLDNKQMGRLDSLVCKGSYTYFTTTAPSNVESLLLDLTGSSLDLRFFGFLIRYFMVFRENYFGEHMHFQTLEEHQQRPLVTGSDDPLIRDHHFRPSNDLDVVLSITADDINVLLPADLYSTENNVRATTSSVSLDLRFTNYFMDLLINSNPLIFSKGHSNPQNPLQDTSESSAQIYVDGLCISGHRLFGLPPTEPTYMCNWDFEVGDVTGECSTDFLKAIQGLGRVMAFQFQDLENLLTSNKTISIRDVTFLRLGLESFRVWMQVEDSAILVEMRFLSFEFNDWARQDFSNYLHLQITHILLAAIDGESTLRRRSKLDVDDATYCVLKTSLDIRVGRSDAHFRAMRQLQQNYIHMHDSRTKRTPWLTQNRLLPDSSSQPLLHQKQRPPAIPLPPVPEPLGLKENVAAHFEGRAWHPHVFRKQSSSFLSQRSKLSASIKRRSIEHDRVPSRGLDSQFRSDESRHNPSGSPHVENPEPELRFGVAFSNPYHEPHFPLQSIQPNLDFLPDDLSYPLGDDSLSQDSYASRWETPENEITHTNVFLAFGTGIEGFCTPRVISLTSSVMNVLQPQRSGEVLDNIQTAATSSVMEKLSDLGARFCVQVMVNIPRLALRLVSDINDDPHFSCSQTYELVLSNLLTTLKFGAGSQKLDRVASPPTKVLHISWQGLRLIVHNRNRRIINDHSRHDLDVGSSTLWIMKGSRFTGQLQIQSIEVGTYVRRSSSLVNLVHGFMLVFPPLLEALSRKLASSRTRSIALISDLASRRGNFADPTFLTTVSYVLRTVPKHLRSTDTWKMLSRLRFTLRGLSEEELQELELKCGDMSAETSQKDLDSLVAAFEQWRGWDLVQVKSSALVQEVYGTKSSNASVKTPIAFGLNLDSLKAHVNPGPDQNMFEIKRFFVSLDLTSQLQRSSSNKNKSKRRSSAALFCQQILLHLNLHVLELVEGFMDELKTTAPQPNTSNSSTSSSSVKVTQQSPVSLFESLDISLAVETIDLCVKGINIALTSLTQSLKLSLLFDRNSQLDSSVNAALHAEVNVSEASSEDRSLALAQTIHPSLHGSLKLRNRNNERWRFWQGGAFCHNIGFEVREDALVLLAVTDALLRDELKYLEKLNFLSQLNSNPAQRSSEDLSTAFKDRLELVCLLKEYRLNFLLFSSLRYAIRGSAIRASLSSTRNLGSSFVGDFDVKRHYHGLENHTDQLVHEVSGLILPSLNGHLKSVNVNGTSSMNVSLNLEKISIDASAMYSIISTLSRQEITRFRQNLMKDAAIVKANHEVLQSRLSTKSAPSPQSFDRSNPYRVSLILHGLDITATTGKSSKQAARLMLHVGLIALHARNFGSEKIQQLLFPEIRGNIGAIKILLERSDGKYGRPCGDVALRASILASSKSNDEGINVRSFEASIVGPEINLYASTAPTIVDILGYLQQKLKNFNLSQEIHTFRARRQRSKSHAKLHSNHPFAQEHEAEYSTVLFNSMYALEIKDVQISWRIGDMIPISPGHEVEDLIFSIERIHLSSRKSSAARLLMANLQLQMASTSQPSQIRSDHSALMPEVMFNAAYVSTMAERRLAFQAVGKSLDIRLTPDFVLPASDLQRSIGQATVDLRKVTAGWNASLLQDEQQNKKLFGNKRLSSVLIDADFAGAIVHLQRSDHPRSPSSARSPQQAFSPLSPVDKVSQGPLDTTYGAILRTPGIAFKIEYQHLGDVNPSLNAEINVDASSNALQPTVVPLILQLTSSVQEIVHENANDSASPIQTKPTKNIDENMLRSTDPAAILGNCKLNLGLSIYKQKFSLTCQPIAKVAATAEFENIYITINTVQSVDLDRFFALSATISNLQTSVQHAYSQESTGSFIAERIELSLMNSRHISDLKGLSAILNFGPMKVTVNARQLQDFLLFREIWLPSDLIEKAPEPPTPTDGTHPIMVQRYREVAAASPFPWNATVSIVELAVDLDLGSSLGKSSFHISKLWTASRKLSNWEQSLYFGFEEVSVESTGRLSCSVGLQNLRLRTSIKWQTTDEAFKQTPLVQASLGFQDLHLKAAFEYQTFIIATFSTLDFIMYNVQDRSSSHEDRLICTVEGDQVQAYCTTQTSAQVYALFQSFQRLIQEKKQAYETSLKDIRRFHRMSATRPTVARSSPSLGVEKPPLDTPAERIPLQLQTNVVVALKYINIGAYPRSFADTNIFKINALGASAKFQVLVENENIRSSLGMDLGQVRVALSPINRQPTSNAFEDISVEEVVQYSTGSRGGTILKVPRVVAEMHTWQAVQSKQVEYIFKSSFEGKVEVGWNINRINIIRSMWDAHSQALASRLGKTLTHSAVQITGVPTGKEGESGVPGKQEKITAVLNVPLSNYNYTAREPPIIETPQLRDMGEATPPLEWIGLHRERLPNLTHQIIIVPLLEVAKEVEDAYGRILGTS